MEQKEVQHIFTEILYLTVNEIQNFDDIKHKITPDVLSSVYQLAKKHDLAHVISDFVYRAGIDVGGELQLKLQREALISVYRCEHMNYAFEEICGAFDKAGISYIPLKGSVLRPYYPYESMRTSCDIDILIHENDLDTAIVSLEAKGYCCGERNYHDVSLYSSDKIHLELHFSIQENMDGLDSVLKDAWKYAVPISNTRYAFSNDFFAFHMFAHMAYHFVSGGCGIRSLLDIWVMEHKMCVSCLSAKALLEKAGIYQFAVEMSDIAEQCFTNNSGDDFADSVLKYIFQGGVYGNSENHIAVDKSKSQSSVIYAIKRLFLPYKYMVISYPILKKAPYLLPFCWIVRLVKAVFSGKSKQIASEMSRVNNISDDTVKEVADICSRLGL